MIVVVLSTLIALLIPIPLVVNAWVASERRWTDQFWRGCCTQHHWDRAAAARMAETLSPPSGVSDAYGTISLALEQWAAEMIAARTSLWTLEPQSGIVRLEP
jgi:hypothetical protein